MKKTLLAALCLALFLCAGCGAEPAETHDYPLTVVTTNFPGYDFARAVAGDYAGITMLLPPGAESHSYEPTPQDMIRIESCDIFICGGGESEVWAEELLDTTDADFRVIRMLDCVDAVEEETKEGMQSVHEEHGDEEEGPEYDEHVWTSPKNAALIAREIAAAACERDPGHERAYNAACESFCAELTLLDEAFRGAVVRGKQDTLIFADRFPVRYFTEEYGLDYFAAFSGCADDAEPSAKTVAFLIDRVRERDIPAVLYIEFSNEKMADVICEDTGCEKLLFHSCHNVTKADFDAGVTYLELMWNNVKTIEEALG